jgi:hypothetical protein
MNLESRPIRRAVATFGIAWNVALPLLVLFQAGPFWRRPDTCYGAWGVVNLAALWSGKADPPGLRAWQNVAFLVATGLLILGVFVFRS